MTRGCRLRYLAEINPATREFDSVADNEPVTFMPLETVWADGRLDTSRTRLKSEVASGYVRFKSGDILSPKVTPTFQAGRSALIGTLPSGIGAASTELHVVRTRTDIADPRYVRYALLSSPFLQEGVSRFQGVAGLQRVPDDFIANFRVVRRSLDEQRRIADFLDDQVTRIDNIIAARRLQAALTMEKAGHDLAQRRAGLEIQFGVGRLGYLLTRLEQGWSPAAEGRNAEAEEWAVMRAGCVNGGVFRAEDHKALPPDLSPRDEYEIRGGDLLMSRASGSLDLIGSVAVVPADVRSRLLLPDKVYRLGTAQDPAFIAAMLRAPQIRELIRLGVSGAEGMANNLPSPVVRSLPIPWVPTGLQADVAAEFTKIECARDKLVDICNQSVAKFEELKRSLITAAVTGEFDVSTASGARVTA